LGVLRGAALGLDLEAVVIVLFLLKIVCRKTAKPLPGECERSAKI
jgi:hypothetical protein